MVQFSTRALRALNHRLEVSDALAECLNEEFGFDPSVVEEIADAMLRGDYSSLNSDVKHIAVEILADCVEGSTYLTCIPKRLHQQRSAAQKDLESLRDELFVLLNRPLEIPRY